MILIETNVNMGEKEEGVFQVRFCFEMRGGCGGGTR